MNIAFYISSSQYWNFLKFQVNRYKKKKVKSSSQLLRYFYKGLITMIYLLTTHQGKEHHFFDNIKCGVELRYSPCNVRDISTKNDKDMCQTFHATKYTFNSTYLLFNQNTGRSNETLWSGLGYKAVPNFSDFPREILMGEPQATELKYKKWSNSPELKGNCFSIQSTKASSKAFLIFPLSFLAWLLFWFIFC